MTVQTEFTIRPLTPDDMPTLLALIRELAEFEGMSARVTATERKLHDTLFGERRFAEGYFGILGGEAVAYAIVHHTYSTFAAQPGLYIEDIYVREAHRRDGCGRRMMRHLAALALARGCKAMSWSVLDWNQKAINFYVGLGAAKYSEWDSYKIDGENLRALAEAGQNS
jgi:ribosomal protein S18 acetylase RimI-like enzyme